MIASKHAPGLTKLTAVRIHVAVAPAPDRRKCGDSALTLAGNGAWHDAEQTITERIMNSASAPGATPDAADVSQLRAMQRLATGLLLLAAAVYVLARMLEQRYAAASYVRAFCEAAMVGGLADWFAVTALFRHPLGVPLPHTAIIPTNKDRIGATLGRFVEQNFLASEIVAEKLAHIEFTAVAGRWLADPRRSGGLTTRLVAWLPRVLDAADAEPVRRFLHHTLGAALTRIEFAPLAADVLELLIARNAHQAVLDEILVQARRQLQEADAEIRASVRSRTAWLWQRLGMDDKVSDRLIAAIDDLLREASNDPEHVWRERFTAAVRDYIARLRSSASGRARAEEFMREVVAHAPLRSYLDALWEALRAQIRADAALPDSRLAAQMRGALAGLGSSLLADDAARGALDAWLRRLLLRVVEQRRHEVATLIAETVRRWDAGTVTERVERAIGRDLQYIRINGTLIGGLVGVLIHVISRLLP
jgi:uncharacterized membrane-anchored protein YjiN (DUF445 family)